MIHARMAHPSNFNRKRIRGSRVAVLLAGLAILQGCAAAGLTVAGAGTGVGMGVVTEENLNAVGSKTYPRPVSEVRAAAIKALDQMELKVTTDAPDGTGWKIRATANDRDMAIDIEELTPVTTRLQVSVADGFLSKDAATASEIVAETTQGLQDAIAEKNREAEARAESARDESARDESARRPVAQHAVADGQEADQARYAVSGASASESSSADQTADRPTDDGASENIGSGDGHLAFDNWPRSERRMSFGPPPADHPNGDHPDGNHPDGDHPDSSHPND